VPLLYFEGQLEILTTSSPAPTGTAEVQKPSPSPDARMMMGHHVGGAGRAARVAPPQPASERPGRLRLLLLD
jgi:hypothetical protein